MTSFLQPADRRHPEEREARREGRTERQALGQVSRFRKRFVIDRTFVGSITVP
jgi:hypothetical protein